MNVSIIQYIKENEKKRIALAALEGVETPVIYKELSSGNRIIYEKIQKLNSDFFPNIYTIEADDSCIKVCEEYVPGQTLSDFLLSGKLDTDVVFDVALQLCDALDLLHSQNPPIIHRDIKPENVIINRDNKIKIVDFDIARLFKPDSEDTDTRLLGTVSYAAPEQFGYSQTDERTDIYSLGIVLKQLMEAAVPGLSGRSLTKYHKLVSRCTSFDPDDRFPSIAELKKALSGLYAGYKRRGSRKYRAFLFSASGILVAGIASLLIFLPGSLSKETVSEAADSGEAALSAEDALSTEGLSVEGLSVEGEEMTSEAPGSSLNPALNAASNAASNEASNEAENIITNGTVNAVENTAANGHVNAAENTAENADSESAADSPQNEDASSDAGSVADSSQSTETDGDAGSVADSSQNTEENGDSETGGETVPEIDPLSVDYLTKGSFTLSDGLVIYPEYNINLPDGDFKIMNSDGSPISELTIEFSIPKGAKLRMLSYNDQFLYQGTNTLELEPPYPGAENPTYKYSFNNSSNHIKLSLEAAGSYKIVAGLYIDYKMPDGTVYTHYLACKYISPYDVWSDGPGMTYLTYTHTFSLWKIINVNSDREKFCEKVADGSILILLGDNPATPVLENGKFTGTMKTDTDSNYVVVYDTENKFMLYSGIYIIEIRD